MKKKFSLFASLLILFAISLLYFVQYSKQNNIQDALDNELSLNQIYYNVVYQNYVLLAKNVYHNIINDAKTVSILKKAKHASIQDRVAIRNDLENHLKTRYKELKD